MAELRIGSSQERGPSKKSVKKVSRPLSAFSDGDLKRRKDTLIDELDNRAYSPKRKPDTMQMLYRALDRLTSLLSSSNVPLENVPRGYYLDIMI